MVRKGNGVSVIMKEEKAKNVEGENSGIGSWKEIRKALKKKPLEREKNGGRRMEEKCTDADL